MRDGQGWDVDGLTVALAEAEAVIEGLTYENERLRAAVQAVRRLPQRPWSEAEADGIEALRARAYNSGLNDARHAIDAALDGERNE